MVKKQRMTSKWHSKTCIIVFRLYSNRILVLSRGRIWVGSALQPVEMSLFDLTENPFWAGPQAEKKVEVPYVPRNNAFSTSAKSDFGMVERP